MVPGKAIWRLAGCMRQPLRGGVQPTQSDALAPESIRIYSGGPAYSYDILGARGLDGVDSARSRALWLARASPATMAYERACCLSTST